MANSVVSEANDALEEWVYFTFCTVLYNLDDDFLFSQQPLGTVRNCKQKTKISPDKWEPIEDGKEAKYRKGNFIVFKSVDGKNHNGFVEKYDKFGAVLKSGEKMTETEFRKKMLDEKLSLKEKEIVVSTGFIVEKKLKSYKYYSSREVFGCTQAINHGKKWYIFGSSFFRDMDLGAMPPEPKYIYDTNKKGKLVPIIVPGEVCIFSSYDTEEEAFDDFYKFVKEKMEYERNHK